MKRPIITVAIDSPAAAGAGTLAKLISKEYNLLYLDTGKIYRVIGKLRLERKYKFNYNSVKSKIANIRIKDLSNKNLLSNEVANSASIIAKDLKIRKLVKNFQIHCAYNPPGNFKGSILDGRDITSVIMKNAMFKFYITANLKTRALRRYKELKDLNKHVTYKEVLKSIKKRDKSDFTRKIAPLKKTKDSLLINTTNLNKRACFLKIKKIIDGKLNN